MHTVITRENNLKLCLILKLSALYGFLILSFSVQAGEPNSCSLHEPPRTSAVSADHGAFYFIYPRVIPKMYSGCQIMWDELGRESIKLRFQRGTLVQYVLVDYSGKTPETKKCSYKSRGIYRQNPTDCPAYENVEHGIPVGSMADDPPIPPERDVRLRGAER